MTYLFRVEGIVQAQTPHSLHVLGREWRKQEAHDGDLVSDFVLAKDAARNDASLLGLGDIGLSRGEDGVTVVDFAVCGEEADEALERALDMRWSGLETWIGRIDETLRWWVRFWTHCERRHHGDLMFVAGQD